MYVAKAGTHYEIGLQQLGMAVIMTHLKAAAVILANVGTPSYATLGCHKNDRHRVLQESVAFVGGSGLETTIEVFNLDLNPQRLRETFYTWAQHRAHHHTAPS